MYNPYEHSRIVSIEKHSHMIARAFGLCVWLYFSWILLGKFFFALFYEAAQITCTRYVMNIILERKRKEGRERLRLKSDLQPKFQSAIDRVCVLLSWFIVEAVLFMNLCNIYTLQ